MKTRILVIDDEPAIRDSMKMILEYEGYEFQGAASGPEGLAAIERDPPDLVFLDIKMPGMDGLEVLDRIKATRELLPVIMISGHGTTSLAAVTLGLLLDRLGYAPGNALGLRIVPAVAAVSVLLGALVFTRFPERAASQTG